MCPACITTAALIASGVSGIGLLSARGMKIRKRLTDRQPTPKEQTRSSL